MRLKIYWDHFLKELVEELRYKDYDYITSSVRKIFNDGKIIDSPFIYDKKLFNCNESTFDKIKQKLHKKLSKWWKKNMKNPLINMHEGAQIQRLVDYIEVVNRGHNTTEMDIELQYHDIKSFYTQYDIRRNKNFVETFPELKKWYESIKIDNTIPDVKVTDGRITHFEPGVYVSDVKNYNK